jgi:crotonobetainyl-CoA:carnitine CoA-transferase CaiB-like acyl-CoA transferase
MVATAVSELVKVNAPLLDDVGADIVKVESPKVFDGATNDPKVGAAALTTNVVVLVDAV